MAATIRPVVQSKCRLDFRSLFQSQKNLHGYGVEEPQVNGTIGTAVVLPVGLGTALRHAAMRHLGPRASAAAGGLSSGPVLGLAATGPNVAAASGTSTGAR